MISPEIINWIKVQLTKGADQQTITENLLKQGWTQEDINIIFQSVPVFSNNPDRSTSQEISPPTAILPTETPTNNISFGKTILKILLVLLLFGLLPIIYKILERFLFISFIPSFYLISLIILLSTFFAFTLIISKKLGNIHPLFILLVSLGSGGLIFWGNMILCSLTMLIPCQQSSLFSPLAILFTIDVNGVLLFGYFFASIFIRYRKDKGYSLMIPSISLIIVFIIILVIIIFPNIRSYITQEATKNISDYQKIPDLQPTKQIDITQKQNKIPFKQSLELALAKAKEYDSGVKTSIIRLAEPGEANVYIQSGFTKIVPIPGKDTIIGETSNKNNVTVIIDGDTGQIKDSYKFAYDMGEKGIDDFSDFNYGPLEAVNLIKATEKYKRYKEKVPKDNGLIAWFKPTEKPYHWEIWTNANVNNELYQVRFFVSTQDLSIQKAILDLGKNQEIPVNNKTLPNNIDPTGGKVYYDKELNFTIKYPSSYILDHESFRDNAGQLYCSFYPSQPTDIIKETIIKENSPKITKVKVSTNNSDIKDKPYITQEAYYLITQDKFPKLEFKCFNFQEKYREIIEQMLLTIEFTDY